jgi:hypothetical protein
MPQWPHPIEESLAQPLVLGVDDDPNSCENL